MEKRIQKLNNPEQSGTKVSLPFPIELLRTAPVTLPQKRVSKTSCDSGVNYPQVRSPAMPLTPENLQRYLEPSMSRANFPSGPLTPIQQFINTSHKSQSKEPKNNGSQPDYYDPQSVLRTRTGQGYRL